MVGVCLTCGLRAALEAHHVAGRHNHATLTVAVCVDCHRVLSTWQLAAGTELHDTDETCDLDATRALLVGVVHLIGLYGQRHPDVAWIPAPLAVHSARAVSKLLDFAGSAHRPGRWLPDPTMTPAEATPIEWPGTTEVERISDMAHLAGYLNTLLGNVIPQLAPVLAHAAAHPDQWKKAVDRAAADIEVAAELRASVGRYVHLSGPLIIRLLHLEDPDQPDEQLLTDLADWFHAAHHLLDLVLSVAAPELGVAS